MIVVQRKQFRAQNEIEPAQEYLNFLQNESLFISKAIRTSINYSLTQEIFDFLI